MGTTRTYPNDLGRRAAAARGYLGWGQQALADRLGVGRNAIRELEESGQVGKGGRRTELVLHGIARETGLPYEFFTIDFKAAAEALEERSEVSQLRTDVKELQEHLRRLQVKRQVAEVEEHGRSGEGARSRKDPPRQ